MADKLEDNEIAELEEPAVLKPGATKLDAELERYRSLMETPSTFEDGFSWISLAGALFVALLMVPGAMYMGLLAGNLNIGPAAQWVTVILFIEVAKRANKTLKKAEIFVFFYIAGSLLSTPFGGLVWNQFFIQSDAAKAAGIAENIPAWFAPRDPAVLRERSFFMWDWMPVIGMIVFQQVVGRINGVILCYGLFRVASDIEKLPFPMAPIGAQGVLALAEDADETESGGSWRKRVFSIGGAMGIAFGLIYVGMPTITQAFFGDRVEMIPIPFVDWTPRTQEFLPAVATGLSFDLGNLIVGMVLPFYAMVGSVLGLLVTFVMNPILQRTGFLPSWQNGDTTVLTGFKNTIDFYLSFGIGVSIAVALIGFYAVWKGVKKLREQKAAATAQSRLDDEKEMQRIKERGHIPFTLVLAVYLFTTLAYIVVSGFLINWHTGVMVVLIFYGFLYTPIISYVTARLEGMVGQAVEIPLVREAGFILSGYRGVEVWFIPLPLHNYGIGTVFYRQAELVGTKFWSKWKSDLFLFPIILISSILFANLIWSLAPVPSAAYPYASRMWELEAKNQCIYMTSTSGEYSLFEQALNGKILAAGTVTGLVVYGILGLFGMPMMLMYGVVRGLNQTMPHYIIPQFIGALLGKFYFEKKLGGKWMQYVPVLSAGYFCGAGLISILCIGMVFLSKAVFQSPF